MANKEYIERLQMVIRQLHKCDAEHLRTDPVKETFRGQTVWEGDVEVFTVMGHPRAKHAYAWSVDEGTPHEKFTAVRRLSRKERNTYEAFAGCLAVRSSDSAHPHCVQVFGKS